MLMMKGLCINVLHFCRDHGRVVVLSHIYLLLACALPVWCWALLTVEASGSHTFADIVTAHPLLRLIPHVGYITVGLGDGMVSSIELASKRSDCSISMLALYILYGFTIF